MGLFGDLQRPGVNNPDATAEMIMQYEESYMKLLRTYEPEITKINQMMKELREEERQFWDEEFPKIKNTLENDGVLSNDAKAKWLEQYHDQMMTSFKMSSDLIEHYVRRNLEEFKKAIETAKRKV